MVELAETRFAVTQLIGSPAPQNSKLPFGTDCPLTVVIATKLIKREYSVFILWMLLEQM